MAISRSTRLFYSGCFAMAKKKKTVKLTKKSLTICKECGRPKIKDERIVTEDRMGLIDENLFPHKTEGVKLS